MVHSLLFHVYGGVTTADDLMKIAEVAKKYNVPLVKITGASRIGLYGVKKQDLPNVWADLNMTSGYAYSKSLQCKIMCWLSFLPFRYERFIRTWYAPEQSLEMVDTPHKMKMGVTAVRVTVRKYLRKILALFVSKMDTNFILVEMVVQYVKLIL